jgi:hypothetical protein
LDVAVYEVIVEPPYDTGAVNAIGAEALPKVATMVVGASGTVGPLVGVTLFDTALEAPVPAALVAVTVKVYAVPLVNPETVIGLAVPVPVTPAGSEVTV